MRWCDARVHCEKDSGTGLNDKCKKRERKQWSRSEGLQSTQNNEPSLLLYWRAQHLTLHLLRSIRWRLARTSVAIHDDVSSTCAIATSRHRQSNSVVSFFASSMTACNQCWRVSLRKSATSCDLSRRRNPICCSPNRLALAGRRHGTLEEIWHLLPSQRLRDETWRQAFVHRT